MHLIPEKLKHAPFNVLSAKKEGISYEQLRGWVRNGIVQRLERGVYQVSGATYNDEEIFQSAVARLGEPSAVCMLSALAFYHLTDEIPSHTWVMVPKSKRSQHKDLRLLRTENPHWNIGVDTHEGFKITSLERTIVEAIAKPRHMGKMLGIAALKVALSERKTTLNKIIKMANELGFQKKLFPVIEALV